MWCAWPTRSPHSPSASSCPKDSPLLKVRPSLVEWAISPPLAPCSACASGFFVPLRPAPPAFWRKYSAFLRLAPAVGPLLPRWQVGPRRARRQSPTARTVPRMCEQFTCAPARRLPRFPAPPPRPSAPRPALASRPPPSPKAKPHRSHCAPHVRAVYLCPAAPTSPHPTQKRPNLIASRRKNVTVSTHSF